MGRRQTDSDRGRCALLILFLIGTISCSVVYLFLSSIFKTGNPAAFTASDWVKNGGGDSEAKEAGECCRGVEFTELWGDAVKWGSDFKVDSPEECCMACKGMCRDENGPCLCDSWVFCGSREACGSRFGECWLKKQKDSLEPVRRESSERIMWTSGVIFGKGEGIVGLQTEFGILQIKLFPDCAPRSVSYILDLLASRHCAGCHFYRAESRGSYWNSDGSHVKNAPYGPPFALIQGTLEATGTPFKEIPLEFCPNVSRGSVAWVGTGPEFFISLANHHEWTKPYTVFGSVLLEDMKVLEKIAQLPTRSEIWNNINVSVLEKPVSLKFQRVSRLSIRAHRKRLLISQSR